MSGTEHLIGFVAMAVAILAILTIGTLAAADILHVGRSDRAVPIDARPDDTSTNHQGATLPTERRWTP